MGLPRFTLVLSILNFIGSTSSALGSGLILLCYILLPPSRHFRHILILNLAVADFLNATNLAASGSLILIRQRPLGPGPACVFNGFLGQITVQATDTSIFAITLVTVYTITRTSTSRMIQAEWSRRAVFLTCVSIWLLPTITSFLALGKGWYGPVSGNWCWLIDRPAYSRYVLTHGWRFLFIFLEIGLSIYLHFYLKGHFRSLQVPIVSAPPTTPPSFVSMVFRRVPSDSSDEETEISLKGPTKSPTSSDFVLDAPKASVVVNDQFTSRPGYLGGTGSGFSAKLPAQPQVRSHTSFHEHPRYKAVQRVLLLNAYPLFYILLWTPGLANRLIEASGHKSKVTQIMQASTQFVGLANALTYGWNERVARGIRLKYMNRRR